MYIVKYIFLFGVGVGILYCTRLKAILMIRPLLRIFDLFSWLGTDGGDYSALDMGFIVFLIFEPESCLSSISYLYIVIYL